jgi:uncharacterized protein YdeI (BOF family)
MKRPALAVVAILCLDLVLSAQVANGVQGEQATQTQEAGGCSSSISKLKR